MIDVSRPLMARIFDFDREYIGEDGEYIVRKVDQIEFPCQHHDNAIIWYNGLKSEIFELIEQD